MACNTKHLTKAFDTQAFNRLARAILALVAFSRKFVRLMELCQFPTKYGIVEANDHRSMKTGSYF